MAWVSRTLSLACGSVSRLVPKDSLVKLLLLLQPAVEVLQGRLGGDHVGGHVGKTGNAGLQHGGGIQLLVLGSDGSSRSVLLSFRHSLLTFPFDFLSFPSLEIRSS